MRDHSTPWEGMGDHDTGEYGKVWESIGEYWIPQEGTGDHGRVWETLGGYGRPQRVQETLRGFGDHGTPLDTAIGNRRAHECTGGHKRVQ